MLNFFFSRLRTVSSEIELFVTTADAHQKPLNPERITVGNATDLAVEIRCASRSTEKGTVTSELAVAGGGAGAVIWEYSENSTAVEPGLKALGTSQSEDGVLRIFPIGRIYPPRSKATFQCKHVDSGYAINVTLELSK